MKNLVNFINESIDNRLVDKFVRGLINFAADNKLNEDIVKALIAGMVDKDVYRMMLDKLTGGPGRMSISELNNLGHEFVEEDSPYIDDETYEYMTNERTAPSFDEVYDRYLEMNSMK